MRPQIRRSSSLSKWRSDNGRHHARQFRFSASPKRCTNVTAPHRSSPRAPASRARRRYAVNTPRSRIASTRDASRESLERDGAAAHLAADAGEPRPAPVVGEDRAERDREHPRSEPCVSCQPRSTSAQLTRRRRATRGVLQRRGAPGGSPDSPPFCEVPQCWNHSRTRATAAAS